MNENNFDYILDNGNYDRFYEHFWLNFKKSVNTYIKIINMNNKLDILGNISLYEYIFNKSIILDNLKLNNKFSGIPESITESINLIGKVYIDNYNEYYFHLFIMNIKRWLKICPNSINNNVIFLINKFGKNICIDKYLYNLVNKNNYNIIELINNLIKDGQLDYLSKLHDNCFKSEINKFISKKYNIKLDNNICLRKIRKKIHESKKD